MLCVCVVVLMISLRELWLLVIFTGSALFSSNEYGRVDPVAGINITSISCVTLGSMMNEGNASSQSPASAWK